jgi:hypothetical protein
MLRSRTLCNASSCSVFNRTLQTRRTHRASSFLHVVVAGPRRQATLVGLRQWKGNGKSLLFGTDCIDQAGHQRQLRPKLRNCRFVTQTHVRVDPGLVRLVSEEPTLSTTMYTKKTVSRMLAPEIGLGYTGAWYCTYCSKLADRFSRGMTMSLDITEEFQHDAQGVRYLPASMPPAQTCSEPLCNAASNITR